MQDTEIGKIKLSQACESTKLNHEKAGSCRELNMNANMQGAIRENLRIRRLLQGDAEIISRAFAEIG